MAFIKKVSFSRVGDQEGCTCSRCGQYIKNIWTITYKDDVVLHFGIDCFEKLNKGKLSAYGQKLMKKALKSIEDHQTWFERDMALTEATDIAWQNDQQDKQSYWYGRPYEEYKQWKKEEFWPERFKEDQKRINQFSKVNFDR